MYTANDIKRRLEEQTANRYYRKDQEISSEMKMMMDWMSWEMASVYHQVNQSNDYILGQVEQFAFPSFKDRPIPSHHLEHMFPQNPHQILEPEEEPIIEHVTMDRGIEKKTFFTPLKRTALTKSYVQYRYCQNELVEYDHDGTVVKAYAPIGDALHHGLIWWGLRVDKGIGLTQAINLFCDIGHGLDVSKNLTDYWSNDIQWTTVDGAAISSQNGISHLPSKDSYDIFDLDHERLYNHHLEQTILDNYQYNYCHLDLSAVAEKIKSKIPHTLSTSLSEEEKLKLKEESVIWICSKLASQHLKTDPADILLRTNIVPVCNRKMSKEISVTVGPGNSQLQSIPLRIADQDKENEKFLALQSVFSSKGNYSPVRIDDRNRLRHGTYCIHRSDNDINDWTNIYQRARELQSILTDQWALISTNEKQNNYAKEMGQSIKRELDKMDNKLYEPEQFEKKLINYIRVMPKSDNEEIKVRFWVRQ